jgi:hypothetical protein
MSLFAWGGKLGNIETQLLKSKGNGKEQSRKAGEGGTENIGENVDKEKRGIIIKKGNSKKGSN